MQEGQTVKAQVQSVDAEQQRISLSIKALEARPLSEKELEERAQREAEENAPPPEPAKTSKRSKPLKGGIGHASGGERFGLKW